MSGFPWREYSSDELGQEYEKLQTSLDDLKVSFPMKHSLLGMRCSNAFFQYERMNTPSQGKRSCYEMWHKDGKAIRSRYKKYTKTNGEKGLHSYVTLYYTPPAQFPPFIAGAVYKYFKAKKVLDPFAGWGDRCIAAMALGIDYIGIDSNRRLRDSYKQLIDFYPSKSDIEIHIKKCQDVNLSKMDFDLVFTSPPYWKDGKLLEKYNDCDPDYEDFMINCLYPLMLQCLKRNIWVCLHLPLNMYEDIKEIFGSCKLKLQFTNRSNRSGRSNIIYCW